MSVMINKVLETNERLIFLSIDDDECSPMYNF